MIWIQIIGVVVAALVLWVTAKNLIGRRPRPDDSLPSRVVVAQQWLLRNGYQIVHRDIKGVWKGTHNDDVVEREVFADFIVRKGATHYAVRVLPPTALPAKEDQLYETWYPTQQTLGVQGVLHLDVEGGIVNRISFDHRPPLYVLWRKWAGRLSWMFAGIVIALAWMYRR